MGKEFQFDLEIDLAVPPGAFAVIKIDFLPQEGSVTVFGYLPDASFSSVEISGPQESFPLPFNRPKIFLRRSNGLRRLTVETVHWTAPKGCGGPAGGD